MASNSNTDFSIKPVPQCSRQEIDDGSSKADNSKLRGREKIKKSFGSIGEFLRSCKKKFNLDFKFNFH